ncbi:MAG TPA: hypothetical protein VFP72_15975 [Kineosporiaceae bacterium]|nr:hypothetical protein [Kineosporiaceae bacterium]
MRRATAVRRLRTIAERARQVCSLWEPGTGLVSVHAFGPVLDVGEGEEPSIDVIEIVLVVEAGPDELTWSYRPPTYTGLPYVLDLEKAPVDWYFRAAGQPVGNHRIVRPLPIWSREGGVHEEALTALAEGRTDVLDRLREPAARPAVLQRQLAEELAAARAQLQRVRDAYWQRRWRQSHHAAGTAPENYLWDAVNGYLDLLTSAEGDGGPAGREARWQAPDEGADRSGPRAGRRGAPPLAGSDPEPMLDLDGLGQQLPAEPEPEPVVPAPAPSEPGPQPAPAARKRTTRPRTSRPVGGAAE